MQQQLCVSPIELIRKSKLLRRSALRYFCADYEIPSNPTLRFWGTRDQTTIVTFTVKFYYTETFAKVTPDVEGWIDNSIAVGNQAMINSLVPVRVKKFATEMAMIPEFRCSS